MFDFPAGLLHATNLGKTIPLFLLFMELAPPPARRRHLVFSLFVRQVKPLPTLAMKGVKVKPVLTTAKDHFQCKEKADSNNRKKPIPKTVKS